MVRRRAVHRRRFHLLVRGYLQQPEIVPTPTPEMRPQGKPGRMVKVDETTVRWEFDVPYFLFEEIMAGDTAMGGGQAVRQAGKVSFGAYAPGALPQAVPAEIFVRRGGERAREAGGLRELGADAALQEGLGTQPRRAGARAVAQRAADQQPDLAAGAQSVLLRGRYGGQPVAVFRPGRSSRLPRISRSSTCARWPANTTSRSVISTWASCRCCSITRRRATTRCIWISALPAPTSCSTSTRASRAIRKSANGSPTPISAARCRLASTATS